MFVFSKYESADDVSWYLWEPGTLGAFDEEEDLARRVVDRGVLAEFLSNRRGAKNETTVVSGCRHRT